MRIAGIVLFMAAAGLISGCATSTPTKDVPENQDTDPMIVELSTTARKQFEAGEIPGAVVMYRRALERARAMDNSREIGRNAYNLAATMIALEEWEEAIILLKESERETLKAGDDAGPVILLAAKINRLRDQPGEAEAAIDRLEKLPISDDIRGQAYVLRAHISCDRNDAARADAFLERARGFLRKKQDDGLAGEISQVSGRIAMIKGEWLKAASAFDREAAWMQKSARLPEMAEALERAGQNYLKAGDRVAASDRFYRSARSLMAQKNYLGALQVIEQTTQSLEEEGGQTDAETEAAIANLFNEIRQSVEKNSQADIKKP